MYMYTWLFFLCVCVCVCVLGWGAQKSDKDFTRITFRPDLTKFSMTELDDDTIALMSRRVYDVAGTTRGIKVYLNNTRLPVKTFKDYVNLVLRDQ